jgi:type II secretory ATPase GspE/PulE/Tfp pilus assembly ATPase PilB-like protein
MTCQLLASGERVTIQLDARQVPFENLDAVGMPAEMQGQLAELLSRKQGLILFAALPGGGLRSTMNVVLRSTDRFVREFVALEAEDNRYEEVENIPVTTYPVGAEVPDVLTRLLRTEPQVVVVRDLIDAETLAAVCQASVDHLMLSSLRAAEGADALLRARSFPAAAGLFAQSITAVLSQRLVRRLCPHCKEAYIPTPETLEQLGISPGGAPSFSRPPQAPQEEVCAECNGIGYRGQVAIFELLVVDDQLRELLPDATKSEILQAARQSGQRTLLEEGVMAAAQGVTSLAELARVLKS